MLRLLISFDYVKELLGGIVLCGSTTAELDFIGSKKAGHSWHAECPAFENALKHSGKLMVLQPEMRIAQTL